MQPSKLPHISLCGLSFMLTHAHTDFVNVVLVQTGKKQIDVIQVLREITTTEAIWRFTARGHSHRDPHRCEIPGEAAV
jgi:hypothetical protein